MPLVTSTTIHYLTKNGLIMGAYATYEEAEIDCLNKLIEIASLS
jgi:hypothetical protein